jgi:lipid-binding SYLF domain-containing protein
MMNRLSLAAVAALALFLGACATTSSSDKATKQAEIRKATQASLEKFYQADPSLKSAVASAPGYGIFTTYGLSFIIGGAGGSGLVHNNRTGTDTFMDTAQASAGLQAGAAQTDTLIVFKTAESMQNFVDKGWGAGVGASAQAGATGKSVGPGGGGDVISDANYYTLTPNGLQGGVAAAGTKFWKDKDLN